MIDRELLELAAKAADIGERYYVDDFLGFAYEERSGYWNPLTDDGDALRLAVKLGIKVTPYPIYEQPKHSVLADKLALSPDGTMGPQVIEIYRDDPMAAPAAPSSALLLR